MIPSVAGLDCDRQQVDGVACQAARCPALTLAEQLQCCVHVRQYGVPQLAAFDGWLLALADVGPEYDAISHSVCVCVNVCVGACV